MVVTVALGLGAVGASRVGAGMVHAGAIDCSAAAFGVFVRFEVADFDGFFVCHIICFLGLLFADCCLRDCKRNRTA